jgi:2-methylcitrate dehydratase PrpD
VDPYRVALTDWLACAARGAREPAARAAAAVADADGLAGEVAALGAAGHVLDFDDTYLPGLVHLSAPVAPAALVLAARRDESVEAALAAYAAGLEAMGALARASHPALYDGGWHPTAVCGPVGAAVAAARLLGLDTERARDAAALALLRAGGLRAAFGSDGKALQVGLAAASGVQAARLAGAGATVDAARIEIGTAGFQEAFGATFAAADEDGPTAIAENWIKAYPCCLQSHGAIEAALRAADAGVATGDVVTVVVHPVSRRAAALDDVQDGLQAKFSIPYLTAWALRHGAPVVESFEGVDERVRADATRVEVHTDAALAESEALVLVDGATAGHVEAALGSPQRPMDAAALAAKVRALAGPDVAGALDDPARPAAEVLALAEARITPRRAA